MNINLKLPKIFIGKLKDYQKIIFYKKYIKYLKRKTK